MISWKYKLNGEEFRECKYDGGKKNLFFCSSTEELPYKGKVNKEITFGWVGVG